MIDLSARVIHKAHFNIHAQEQGKDLLAIVIENIRVWLHRKYSSQMLQDWNWRQFAKYGQFSAGNKVLSAISTCYDVSASERYWACRIHEYTRTRSYAPRIFTTEIGFEQVNPNMAVLSYVYYYADAAAGYIGETEPPVAPSTVLLYRLLTHPLIRPQIRSSEVFVHPRRLLPGDGLAFVNTLLSPKRGIPVLLVLPYWVGDKCVYPVELRDLARAVLANALVYYTMDQSISDEISYYLGGGLLCYPGSIQIYFPDVNHDDVAGRKRHRFIPAEEAQRLGPNKIIEIMKRAFSQDIRYYESKYMFRVEDCTAMYKAQKYKTLRNDMVRSLEHAQLTAKEKNEYMQLFSLAADELDKMVMQESELKNKRTQDAAHIETLMAEIQDLKKKINAQVSIINRLTSKINIQQVQLQSCDKALASVRSCAHLPTSNSEVMMYYESVFAERLAFTDQAKKTIKKCSTKITVVWNCFYHMATTLYDLLEKQCPTIERSYLELTGWELARGAGSETRANPTLMSFRMDDYMGRKISIEAHVKKGTNDNSPNSIRVYFAFDRQTLKLVIGYVGGHIPNHSTRYKKN